MKLLVTGYKGFIGQFMTRYLLGQGHQVAGVDINDTYDLTNIDRVIHLGAISSTTCTDTELLYKVNYKYSVNLIEQCVQREIPIQIASSASVYGIKNVTFKETDTPAPVNHYAWSKLLVEEYALGLKTTTPVQLFRYFNVYGPGEDHKGDQASPFYKFEQQARTGTIKVFEGSHVYKRDFIHVREICNLHHRFFNVGESGIWNFGTGNCKSFEDVATEIKQNYNCKIEYIPIPDNVKNSYQTFTQANMEKTMRTLNHANT